MATAPAAMAQGVAPLRNVTIELEAGTRDQFLVALEVFAERNAFAIRVTRLAADVPWYTIQLWRMDIFGVGRNPFLVDVFEIGFFRNHEPATVQNADALIDDLEDALAEVPGAVITEIR
ncbi:MAG: hypothetical protein KIT43_09020 [Bauldia sp.]|nr:hypothetical protein [Bauldia sp.]